MKNLTEYIKENSVGTFNENKKVFDAEYGQVVYDKLVNGIKLSDDDKVFTKNAESVFPVDEQQLRQLIIKLKEKKISLNWLDVTGITNMFRMFFDSNFNGDISKWDVSNVRNMSSMFYKSKFNGDISKWDVSNVTDMRVMFQYAEFNRDISKWDISNVDDMDYMFYGCHIKDEYKPKI